MFRFQRKNTVKTAAEMPAALSATLLQDRACIDILANRNRPADRCPGTYGAAAQVAANLHKPPLRRTTQMNASNMVKWLALAIVVTIPFLLTVASRLPMPAYF